MFVVPDSYIYVMKYTTLFFPNTTLFFWGGTGLSAVIYRYVIKLRVLPVHTFGRMPHFIRGGIVTPTLI